jgi:hypothetical protein
MLLAKFIAVTGICRRRYETGAVTCRNLKSNPVPKSEIGTFAEGAMKPELLLAEIRNRKSEIGTFAVAALN